VDSSPDAALFKVTSFPLLEETESAGAGHVTNGVVVLPEMIVRLGWRNDQKPSKLS
jgi:hypothetical protein